MLTKEDTIIKYIFADSVVSNVEAIEPLMKCHIRFLVWKYESHKVRYNVFRWRGLAGKLLPVFIVKS